MKFRFPAPVRRIGKFVQNNEKLLLAILAVVIVVSGGLWYREYFNIDGPAPGGTYVDGVVGGPEELDMVAAKLTKTGLFSVDAEGRLQNQLIDDWSVNTEKTKYSFDLKEGIDGFDVADVLNQNVELFGPGFVSDDGNGVVSVSLNVPNPNLPILLAQPLFDHGPYKLSKKSNTTAIFTRNTSEFAPKPYINKIVVHLFSDEDALREALEKHKIDGARLSSDELVEGYTQVAYDTASYYAVVLNINRSPFRNAAYRQKLVNGQPVSRASITLTVAAEEPLKTIAKDVERIWEKQGLTVAVDIQPTAKISEEISPSRNFDALLTGISYLPELDPFYLWHSSQIRPPGNNLSGIKNDKVDQLIGQIEAELSLPARYQKIDELHRYLQSIGALQLLSPITQQFLVDDNVVVAKPYLPLSVRDRWQSVTQWYLK
jgi:ABC-type transport system substrate-binding protein